jgi:hypothetical protein
MQPKILGRDIKLLKGENITQCAKNMYAQSLTNVNDVPGKKTRKIWGKS